LTVNKKRAVSRGDCSKKEGKVSRQRKKTEKKKKGKVPRPPKVGSSSKWEKQTGERNLSPGRDGRYLKKWGVCRKKKKDPEENTLQPCRSIRWGRRKVSRRTAIERKKKT